MATSISLDELKNVEKKAREAEQTEKVQKQKEKVLKSRANKEQLEATKKAIDQAVAGGRTPEDQSKYNLEIVREKVLQFYKFWPEYKPRSPPRDDAPIEVWERELTRLWSTKTNTDAFPMMKGLFNAMLGGIEFFGALYNPFPSYQIRGLTLFLSSDLPEVKALNIEDDIKELTVKYGHLLKVCVELRLIGKIVYAIHMMNSHVMAAEVSPNKMDPRFKDI
jgi:hypothetical protein